MYVKEKGERELGIEITEEEWYNVCRIQHSTQHSFHNPKYEREVCPGTECMLEVMWAGGGKPHTYFGSAKRWRNIGKMF